MAFAFIRNWTHYDQLPFQDWSIEYRRELVRKSLLRDPAIRPCANYDFAVHGGDAGVISRQFVPVNGQFVPANMLLEGAVKNYDGRLRFRQRKYQLSTSLNLIKLRSIGLPQWTPAKFQALSAVDMFVGYLVFDVLVSNTDRHHENWGVVVDYTHRYSPSYNLAPTFDHASSLGRNESDAKRERRLKTKDERDTVEAYASRARSAFYGSAASDQTLRQTEVLESLIRAAPNATRHWATVFQRSSRMYTKTFSAESNLS